MIESGHVQFVVGIAVAVAVAVVVAVALLEMLKSPAECGFGT